MKARPEIPLPERFTKGRAKKAAAAIKSAHTGLMESAQAQAKVGATVATLFALHEGTTQSAISADCHAGVEAVSRVPGVTRADVHNAITRDRVGEVRLQTEVRPKTRQIETWGRWQEYLESNTIIDRTREPYLGNYHGQPGYRMYLVVNDKELPYFTSVCNGVQEYFITPTQLSVPTATSTPETRVVPVVPQPLKVDADVKVSASPIAVAGKVDSNVNASVAVQPTPIGVRGSGPNGEQVISVSSPVPPVTLDHRYDIPLWVPIMVGVGLIGGLGIAAWRAFQEHHNPHMIIDAVNTHGDQNRDQIIHDINANTDQRGTEGITATNAARDNLRQHYTDGRMEQTTELTAVSHGDRDTVNTHTDQQVAGLRQYIEGRFNNLPNLQGFEQVLVHHFGQLITQQMDPIRNGINNNQNSIADILQRFGQFETRLGEVHNRLTQPQTQANLVNEIRRVMREEINVVRPAIQRTDQRVENIHNLAGHLVPDERLLLTQAVVNQLMAQLGQVMDPNVQNQMRADLARILQEVSQARVEIAHIH